MSPARIQTFAFVGIELVPVAVRVEIVSGMTAFLINGVPDEVARGVWRRVRAALASMALSLPARRILISLTPAVASEDGAQFDLPVALGVLAAMGVLPRDEVEEYAAIGELSVAGELRGLPGVLPAALAASMHGLGLICPASQGEEAAWVCWTEVLAAPDLLSIVNHFRGSQVLTPPEPPSAKREGEYSDVAEVHEAVLAHHALEVSKIGAQDQTSLYSAGHASRSVTEANLYVRTATKGPVLRDLDRARVGLLVTCERCRSSFLWDPKRAVDRRGAEVRVAEVDWRCRFCGGKPGAARILGFGWSVGPFRVSPDC